MLAARNAGYDYNKYAKIYHEYSELQSQALGNSTFYRTQRADMNKSNPLTAVAEAYSRLNEIPLLFIIFILPPGVAVAFFTALMGSIGAMVSSLGAWLLDTQPKSITIDQVLFLKPILGALAGFTVFFVISAGAAFLVQPGAKGAIDAVNNLSAPALASLGIFAGLAADNAINWLKSKAVGFFKVP